MLNFRPAKINEAEILTGIAIRSEAYWGYDQAFMESFKKLYSVTEEFISNHPTFVMENEEGIIGFYSVVTNDLETSLEYFYIETKYIGQGYGRILWNHMVDTFKDKGIKEIALITSPQAKDFYINMGAVETGIVDSIVVKNRKIPSLLYKFFP